MIILTIIQPLFGLAFTLIVSPFGISIEGFPLDMGQLLLFITLVSWLAKSLSERQLIIPQTPLNIPLLLFIYITLVTLLWTPSLSAGIKESLKWIEVLLLVWMVTPIVRSQREASFSEKRHDLPQVHLPNYIWIVLMLLIPGFVQALLGIWQFAFSSTEPNHFMVLDRFYRASGSFDQPNPFGGFMNLTLLLGMGVFVGVVFVVTNKPKTASWHCFRKRINLWCFGFLFGFILILTVSFLALIMSWSRGAWLGFVVGGIVFVLFLPKRRKDGILLLLKLSLLILILAIILGYLRPDMLSGHIADRFGSGISQSFELLIGEEISVSASNYAVAERMTYWRAALDMAKDSLWLGIGFGNYGVVYPEYASLRWGNALGHAHNYYLNLLAEVGLIGLSGYVLFWLVVIWQTINLLNRLEWPYRGVALGLLAAWVALAIHNLVDNLYVRNIYIYMGVMLGLLQVMAAYAKSKFDGSSIF